MPCSCQSKRQQFEVLQNGKVVFTSASKPAEAVTKRYLESEKTLAEANATESSRS
ncbi:hypothetical protein ABZY10_33955 [Streptomyces sp. NPDC006539]|uniref:hypothetical protein n=1 Tax=Streptomyces sp. NPDC006539 TaxID=3155352 RepID=UPI0033A3515F